MTLASLTLIAAQQRTPTRTCSVPRSMTIGSPPEGLTSDYFLDIKPGERITKVVLKMNGNREDPRLGSITIETRWMHWECACVSERRGVMQGLCVTVLSVLVDGQLDRWVRLGTQGLVDAREGMALSR